MRPNLANRGRVQRPEIPLRVNGSKNDIRACVAKRKISGGTMSMAGHSARDVTLSFMKTWRKLGASFVCDLGHRLHAPGAFIVPPLPNLVRVTSRYAVTEWDLSRLLPSRRPRLRPKNDCVAAGSG